MDADASFAIETAEQFWKGSVSKQINMWFFDHVNRILELDKVFEAPCETHEHIDDALRSFLSLTTQFKRRFSCGLNWTWRASLIAGRGLRGIGIRLRKMLLQPAQLQTVSVQSGLCSASAALLFAPGS